MSVVPQSWPDPAPQLAAAVAVTYRGKRERPLPVLLRGKLGEWLSDEQFAGAYRGARQAGLAAEPPGLVTIFQKAENLTDRQAAEAVRTRIDWKYALGLGLADPGFDDSILSEFRTRVATGGLDQVVLDTLLQGNTPDSTDRPCQQRQQRLNNKFRAGEDGCGRSGRPYCACSPAPLAVAAMAATRTRITATEATARCVAAAAGGGSGLQETAKGDKRHGQGQWTQWTKDDLEEIAEQRRLADERRAGVRPKPGSVLNGTLSPRSASADGPGSARRREATVHPAGQSARTHLPACEVHGIQRFRPSPSVPCSRRPGQCKRPGVLTASAVPAASVSPM